MSHEAVLCDAGLIERRISMMDIENAALPALLRTTILPPTLHKTRLSWATSNFSTPADIDVGMPVGEPRVFVCS